MGLFCLSFEDYGILEDETAPDVVSLHKLDSAKLSRATSRAPSPIKGEISLCYIHRCSKSMIPMNSNILRQTHKQDEMSTHDFMMIS